MQLSKYIETHQYGVRKMFKYGMVHYYPLAMSLEFLEVFFHYFINIIGCDFAHHITPSFTSLTLDKGLQ
jgi:hypothetical protein